MELTQMRYIFEYLYFMQYCTNEYYELQNISTDTSIFALTNSLIYILYSPLHMLKLLKPRVHARTMDLQ